VGERAIIASGNRQRRAGGARRVTPMHALDPEICHRALRTRDARFDGRLFVGVISTGIYCRPICPARPARLDRCRFFPSAAAAQEAGFRPCLRCRPELAPDTASWRGTSSTVARGLALIAAGGLDGDDASVEELAARLGIGARQLRRLFRQHLGASPVAVAQNRRVLLAKQLLQDTRLPIAEVALAAGFGSVRRFNETFRALFDRPPSALRRRRAAGRSFDDEAAAVTVALGYRPPYDFDAILAHLAARAIDGVERVDGRIYRRTVADEGALGTVEIAHAPARRALTVTIRFPDVRALPRIVARVRRLFDLGADVSAIGAHLARDPLLAPLVAARPGLRVPGGWDGFEIAARAVLGQQVSVEAARRLVSRLVRLCGRALPSRRGDDAALTLAFPRAVDVAGADLSSLGVPEARRRALHAVAEAALADGSLFAPRATVEQTVAALRRIPGVGEWTAQYIALRAAHEPDAFPASDVGLLRGVAGDGGARPTAAALLARAEAWRPWRAYAAQHLWCADAARGAER
jgi:AraC family transcriptional regulator of adaptative response / DNA-3-methyladenine glycosylase II